MSTDDQAEGVALEDRRNQGVLITGKTGSGKTRMARMLAQKWPRIVAFDPTKSVQIPGATIVRTGREAADFLNENWKRPQFRLICRFVDPTDYTRMFAGLYNAAIHTENSVTHKTLIFIDEIDQWSSPNKIDDNLDRLIRFGRHYLLCWIATCRADVETNRTPRMNATQILAFRQGMLSKECDRMLKGAGRLRQENIPHPAELTLWNKKDEEAQENIHFVALQDSFTEWLPTWEELTAGNEWKEKAA